MHEELVIIKRNTKRGGSTAIKFKVILTHFPEYTFFIDQLTLKVIKDQIQNYLNINFILTGFKVLDGDKEIREMKFKYKLQTDKCGTKIYKINEEDYSKSRKDPNVKNKHWRNFIIDSVELIPEIGYEIINKLIEMYERGEI